MIYFLVVLLVVGVTILTRIGKINPPKSMVTVGKVVLAVVATLLTGGSFWIVIPAFAFIHATQIAINAVWDKAKPTDDKSIIGKWAIKQWGVLAGEILFYAEILFLIISAI